MAKRFIDTTLEDQEWFLSLPPRLKCAWQTLCRRCCPIGIWHISMAKLSFEVGDKITYEELEKYFKVLKFEDDKIFIPGFVPFQYGDEGGKLSLKNKFHVSIAKKLKARGLPEPEFKDINDADVIPIPMGIDTHTDGGGSPQGISIRKGKGNKTNTARVEFLGNEQDEAFKTFWEAWPNKVDHTPAKKAFAKKKPPIADLLTAIEKYKKLKPAWKGYMNGATFINTGFEDILRDDYGAEDLAKDKTRQRMMSV